MFGIGLGEILLILFVAFLIAPREIPKMLKRIGQLFAGLENIKRELTDVEREVTDTAREITETVSGKKQPPSPARAHRRAGRSRGQAAAGNTAAVTRSARRPKRGPAP